MKISIRKVFWKVTVSIYRMLLRVYTSWLNGRTILQLVGNFCFNCFFLCLWVVITQSAKRLPKSFRPHIYVKLDLRLDDYMFTSISGSMLTIYCLLSGSWLLYLKFYSPRHIHHFWEVETSPYYSPSSDHSRSPDIEDKSATFELEDMPKLQESIHPTNDLLVDRLNKHKDQKSMSHGHISPPLLFGVSWFLLNFLFQFTENTNSVKFILAWLFYVVLYFIVPIITAHWLYLFHPPGALKLYAFAMGLQNVASVMTHILFPNAPPLYIHYYGETKVPDYDMIYADGLSKPGTRLPSTIYQSIYYANSNKFAAIPSIHSTTAVMTFLFVSYYSRNSILKFLSFAFLLFEWWSTLYLEHHYRLDLFVGLIYSICIYTFLIHWKKGFTKVDQDFIRARLKYDFIGGTTMGMRIFQNTRFQKFFDPLL